MNRKIAFCLAVALVLLSVPMMAQDDDSFQKFKERTEAEFKQFSDSVWRDFSEFRQRANEEYAQFMRSQWESFVALQEEQRPTIPEPPVPYERDKDTPIPNLPILLPVKPLPVPNPSPIDPIVIPDVPQPAPIPSVKEFDFVCYGTPCKVHFDNSLRLKLKDNSENSVADAWEQLTSEMSELLLEDCLRLRKELSLGDWAYYCLIRDLCDQYFGKSTDEAAVMEAYLLAQTGYDLRIGKKDGKLVLLLNFDSDVLCWENSPKTIATYIRIDGKKFYIISPTRSGSSSVFNHRFSKNDRVVSLRQACPPKFAYKPANSRTLTAGGYPELTTTVSINRNLLDFYSEYPDCYWDNYAWAGLSEELKAKLYPMLRKGIAGKGQIEAANRIINFVQTAFTYKTDDGQFGYERALFGDETFYYPYSDCEDRAILFSILVRDILGLDVVLLHYHDHLATAVCFTESMNGYYLDLSGKRYFICDPTYIWANVGMCMPGYEEESPEIFKL